MFCAGRVQEEDLMRTMKACGGAIQTSINSLTDDILGRCALFEEKQIGGERYERLYWLVSYDITLDR
jgi:T-complex protein 1 subunit eta